MRLEHEGQEIEIGLSKAKALLAYLMCTARPISRDTLATLFWPEHDSGRARANLRRTLYQLNQAIGDTLLVATSDAICRNVDIDVWLDVEDFRQAVDACLDDDDALLAGCLDTLEAALAVYRDDFLTGFTLPDSPGFDDWQFFEREALRRTLTRVLLRLVAFYQKHNKWDAAISVTRRWVALDPLHEAAHRHLMQLYALAGEHSAALRQYHECVRILNEELDTAPEPETVTLFEAIQSRQFAPEATGAGPPTLFHPQAQHESVALSLPIQATPFIGREHELAVLDSYLTQPHMRLISIIGPGGIGKTRLALAAAESALSTFAEGVRFVPLAPVSGPEHFLVALAQGIGYRFHGSGDQEEQLLGYLKPRHMLLLIDNFEHLLECGAFLAQILQTAPGIKILATSRERLNLSTETVFNLGGMSYFDWTSVAAPTEAEVSTYEAARLFLYRANMLRPDLQLQPNDYAHVAHICHLVQGMPLALAAGWAELLSLEEIAAEIARSLDFLESDERDLPDRQRSVRATFTYSWQRLSSQEQQIFSRLSVFRGGFTRQAAQAVSEADLSTLRALSNKSFLTLGQEGRYEIHELLRQYAEGQLAQDQQAVTDTANAHSHYYAEFLHERLEITQSFRDLSRVLEIKTELDNIRAAWRWMVRQARIEDLSLAAGAFFYFCQTQSRFVEGAASLEEASTCLRALPAGHDRDLLLAQTLTYRGWLYIRLGSVAQAREVLEESIALYKQHAATPPSTMGGEPRTTLGVLEQMLGHYEKAFELGEEAYRLSEERADPWNLMFGCYVLANASLAHGQYIPAETYAQQAYQLAVELDMRWFMAYILNDLGNIAHALGHYEHAADYYQQSYVLREQQDDPEGMAAALNLLGKNAAAQAEYEQAQDVYHRAMMIYREINNPGGLATSLNGLGQTMRALGDPETARQYLDQALEIAMTIHFLPLIFTILIHIAELLLETSRLGEGLSILSLVSHHAAAEHATRAQAQQRLGHYADQFAQDMFEEAVQRGQDTSLEILINNL